MGECGITEAQGMGLVFFPLGGWGGGPGVGG